MQMQQAISYQPWPPVHPTDAVLPVVGRRRQASPSEGDDGVLGVVKENAVVVLGRRGCCMIHVANRLLLALGVNPVVYEVGESDEEVKRTMEDLQEGISGEKGAGGEVQLPAVFIGGRLFGGLDRIMTTHITGELVPVLKEAGALWL
ncbi:hypothetical protein SAY87_030709 [Trapa incisa]|uniref:Glutaredoxin-C9 n=1 Tax=Trapa incisa TaxID=236973 RepID=A0AAN7QK02_9MYRT|nr:hypothetical protein SAY87_030709 [Trapa incisa]